MGNLRSVEKAFHHVGATGAFVTEDPVEVLKADKAVLPGDGAFDATMERLRATGTEHVVKEFVKSGRPFLGICVGMQCLLTHSEEGNPDAVGLNLVPGTVKRFPANAGLKVPQIGWNALQFPHESALFGGIDAGQFVYFLHSYYCVPDDPMVTTAAADYGVAYCAGLQLGNIHATQFHPEKSGNVGLSILSNFSAL